MPVLSFRFKKRPDAHTLLVLVREDGSFTSNAIGPANGYGPVHDLSHYVAERALDLSEGFLGLVASGWEISDFEIRGAQALLPSEALLAEGIAGALSREEMMRQYTSVEDFNWALHALMTNGGRADYAFADISADMLAAMRAELVELRERWNALAPGETLELSFCAAWRSPCARPAPQRDLAPT